MNILCTLLEIAILILVIYVGFEIAIFGNN